MTKARDLANASTALSAVDATELGYLDGVTSNIQTQFGNISGSKAQPTEPASPTDGMIWVDTDGAVTDAQYIAKSLLTTTGDTIYASGANTPARLGIGSTGQVLSVSGGVPTWSASSSMTLLSTTSLTGSTVNITGISTAYKQLQIVIRDWWPSTATTFYIRFNNNSTSNAYLSVLNSYRDGAGAGSIGSMDTYFNNFASNTGNAQVGMTYVMTIYDYANTTSSKVATGINYGSGTNQGIYNNAYVWKGTAAVTEFNIGLFAGTFSGGSVLIYGVN